MQARARGPWQSLARPQHLRAALRRAWRGRRPAAGCSGPSGAGDGPRVSSLGNCVKIADSSCNTCFTRALVLSDTIWNSICHPLSGVIYLLACREPSAVCQSPARRTTFAGCSCSASRRRTGLSSLTRSRAGRASYYLPPTYLSTSNPPANPYITPPMVHCCSAVTGHRHSDEEFMFHIKYGHLNDYQIYRSQAWPTAPK